MVQHSPIDRTFAALADPTRRGILERLGTGSATISELAEPFGITLTGTKKHVQVLEDAELVSTAKVGRERRCSLGPRRLDDVEQWVAMHRRMLEERPQPCGEPVARPKGFQPGPPRSPPPRIARSTSSASSTPRATRCSPPSRTPS